MGKQIYANWKMNKVVSEAVDFLEDFNQVSSDTAHIAAPAPLIHPMTQINSSLVIGAQDIACKSSGAYTGECSAAMMKSAGANFTLIGHSERRHLFGETIDQTKLKISLALKEELQIVLCVGETSTQRKQKMTRGILTEQIKGALANVKVDASQLLVAYEPVWAIGSGEAASIKTIQESHQTISSVLKEVLDYGNKIPVLYGGSVNADNIQEILAVNEVSGVLVGGASLKIDSFVKILSLSK